MLPRLEFPKTWLQMLLFYIHPTSVAVPHSTLLISESSRAGPRLPKVQGYLLLLLSSSLELGHGKTSDSFQRNENIKTQDCIPMNLDQMALAKERALAKAPVSVNNHTFSSSHSTCALKTVHETSQFKKSPLDTMTASLSPCSSSPHIL